MRFFTNKKIWSKVIIVLIFVLLLEFIVTKPTLAADDVIGFAGVLLSPILSLVVNLADGMMGIIHSSIMGADDVLIEIDLDSQWWEILGRIVCWVLAAAIAIIIIGTGVGGLIAALTTCVVVGVVGTSCWDMAGDALGITKVQTASYVQENLPSTLHLPAYTISPEEIFQGKVLLFSVDFFSDSNKEIKEATKDRKDKDGNTLNEYNQKIKDKDGNKIHKDADGNDIEENEIKSWEAAQEIDHYYYEDKDENGNSVQVTTSKQNMAQELKKVVSSWYNSLKNIALVAMLSILVYIGIRILLASIASEKAKYKQMLQDWLIGIILLVLMHYIMSFSVFIVGKIINIISTTVDENMYTSIIPNDSSQKLSKFVKQNGLGEYWISSKGEQDENVNDENGYLVYPSNLIGYARIRAELGNWGTEYIGWAICFIVLVMFTLFFIFTYLKRVLYMAFLTMIAPLVAVTYPIDKMNDGSAQGFNKWFKEYVFNLLIQPLHLLLYYMLLTSAFDLASQNIIYTLVALGFMIPAEKLLRSFFGFEKAQTPGMLAGPGGAALAMAAVNKLSNLGKGHGGKGNSKGEGKSGSDEEGNARTPRMNGNVDENAIFDEDNTNKNETLPDDNIDNETQNNSLLDAYDENYGTDEWDAQERDALARETSEEQGMKYSDDEYKQILKDSGYSDEEIAELMNANNQNIPNNLNNSTSDRIRKLPPETRQPKRKKKLKRRAARAIKAGGKYMYRAGKGTLKNAVKKAPKTAIRFAGKATGGIALGAVGLAAGIAAGDPSQAFNNALVAGGVGYSLGGNLADRVVALDEKTTNGYKAVKSNMRQYEDLAHDDYIKGKKKEYKEILIDNFGKKRVKEMYENGIMDKYIENKVDDVGDIITAEKMRESDPEMNLDRAILIAKSAKRVGDDYNTPKSKEWEGTFAEEYQQKLGANQTNANKAAKQTMSYIAKFNKTKKTIYK